MKKLFLLSALIAFALPANAGVQCSTDAWGNTTCYGTNNDSGYSSRSSTDAWGNTTTTDNRGNTMRCSTDAWGNTTCY